MKAKRMKRTTPIEPLELRRLLATFAVTNALDFGAGSFREALTSANATAGADIIQFAIGSGPVTIPVLSVLPKQLEPVTIDGSTQPGYAGVPLVTLDGGNLRFNGVHLSGGSSLVRGLTIQRFDANGIECDLLGGNVVEGCRLISNGVDGLNINTSNNRIGGTSAIQRNVMSDNGDNGIDIGEGSLNLIQGNYIGTSDDGLSPLPNQSYGLRVVNSNDNVIGGLTSAHRNVISGNDAEGVRVSGTSSGNQFLGNYIGLNATGTAALPNNGNGMTIFGTGNVIGGTQVGARNIISGNTDDGIRITSSTASFNRVEGNYIGTNPAGTAAIGNGRFGVAGTAGVRIVSSSDNIIGGSVVGAGNLVSGNFAEGIRIDGIGAANNKVRGNLVGTNAAGTGAIPNQADGMQILMGSQIVGGTLAAERNVFSGNADDGIELQTLDANGSIIIGNYFGTDKTGLLALPNASDGIEIQGAMNTVIGGTTAAERNIFAGNTSDGIEVNMNLPGIDGQGTQIRGNWIGVNAAGAALGNLGHGVHLKCGGNTVIGGSTAASNLIANNASDGVYVVTSSGNHISHNSIHDNGGLGIDLAADGITPNDPLDADIGPNGLQNFPAISSATSNGTTTSVSVSLNSTPSSTFTIDLYSNPAADPSGVGEGAVWIGQTVLTTDASGDGTVTLVIPAGLVGSVASAVATDSAGSSSEFSGAVSVTTAVAGPSVASFNFDDNPAVGSLTPHTVTYSFSSPLDPASIQPSDFVVQNLTTGSSVSPAAMSVAYVAGETTLKITFPGLTGSILSDGRYSISIAVGAVSSASGAPTTGTDVRSFAFLTGDVDHNQTVDFTDLLTLAQHYGTSGNQFSAGNFDYDVEGRVEFVDLLLLAQRYGTTLALAPAPGKARRSSASRDIRTLEV